MPDKSLDLLEQYDITPQSIRKGRGGYIIETKDSSYFFQENSMNQKKLEALEYMQLFLHPDFETDLLIRTKEQELSVKDYYETKYILKKIAIGKELNYKDEKELRITFEMLGSFQKKLTLAYQTYQEETQEEAKPFRTFYISDTLQKHTTECRRIQKYLIHKKNKSDFERILLESFPLFLPQAEALSQKSMELKKEELLYLMKNPLCHGDFQYHNIFIKNNKANPGNLEHILICSGIRDFATLFRKISEKNDWDTKIADIMINSFLKNYTPENWEWKQLVILLLYPLKFWKINNHYYNSHKSGIPSKNLEKLECIQRQEKQKQELLKALFLL